LGGKVAGGELGGRPRRHRRPVGHCDKIHIPEYHDEVVRRGAWIQFDTIHGMNELKPRLQACLVLRQVEKGHVDRILLSHDTANAEHRKFSGGTGYT
jgi:phosphotriesterase-related protein